MVSRMTVLVVFSVLTLIGLVTGFGNVYAPGVLLVWFVAGPASSALARHAAHALTPLVMARSGYHQRAVIVGASLAGLAVADRLNNSRRAGKRLLGFFDDRHAGRHARADIQHLGPIRELANYVRSLSGLSHNAELAAKGKERYGAVCIACHGADGKGMAALGAPNLTDKVWLYGSSEAKIVETIVNGRNNQMPAWKDFLGEAKIHVLAAYVLALSSGAAAK